MKSAASKKEAYSIGYLRLSKNFKETAESLLKNNPENHFSPPIYFLFCHALELLIKSYLKTVGFKEVDLKSRRYGHDLQKLLQEARNKGLDNHVRLSGAEIGVILKINPYYKEKEFEYLVPAGGRSFPSVNDLKLILDRLCNAIEPLCRQNSALEAKKQIKAKKSPTPA